MSLHRPKPYVKFLILDVSGTTFKLMHNFVLRYPDSLLAQMAFPDKEFNCFAFPKEIVCTKFPNEFHVSRSPKLFDDIVLQFYITGKLHISDTMCKDLVKEEIQFWKLEANNNCSCWANLNYPETVTNDNDNGTTVMDNNVDKESSYTRIKKRIWSVCDSHNSTTVGAKVSKMLSD